MFTVIQLTTKYLLVIVQPVDPMRKQREEFWVCVTVAVVMLWIWERIKTMEYSFYDGLIMLLWPAVFAFQMHKLGSSKIRASQIPIVILFIASMARGAQLILVSLSS